MRDDLPYEPLTDDAGQPVVISHEDYFAQPGSNHPHPAGFPCHHNCRNWLGIDDHDDRGMTPASPRDKYPPERTDA